MAGRKKRAVISHQNIVDWYVRHPQADTRQIASHFGITPRAAQQHLRKIRNALE